MAVRQLDKLTFSSALDPLRNTVIQMGKLELFNN